MSDDSFVSEINVTPFVDVMLVLLIIFMVTAPMMTEGLEIELPKIKSAEVMSTEESHIMVAVKDDGLIMINDLQADLTEFETFLTDAITHSNGQLFLKADKAVPYGLIMEVMGQIRACGIQDIGMVAESAPLPTEGG